MKKIVQSFLQRILGFGNYLFVFSLFKISTLRWDKHEKDFFHFLDLIPEKGVVLDIGANIGVMTVLVAKKKKNASVLAFEPNPHNLKALKKILSFFGIRNVTVLDFALGDQNTELEMIMPVHQSVKMQGLTHVLSGKEKAEGETFRVQSKRLDDLEEVQKKDLELSAIKIDVENYEYFVLAGGKELLKKYKPLIYCELWEGENRERCFALMKELGYSTKVLQGGRLVKFDPSTYRGQNFFFVTGA